MKKCINKIKHYLPLIFAITLVTIIFFFPKLVFINGVFAIIILLSSLEKLKLKQALIILSPIITYPFFLGTINNISILNLPYPWLSDLGVHIILYALLNGILFKNLWFWLAKNKRRMALLSLIIVASLSFFYGPLMTKCYNVSRAEKGVTQESISKCEMFNLYEPNSHYPSKFRSIPYMMITIPTLGVGFSSTVIILTLVFWEAKNYRKRKKRG